MPAKPLEAQGCVAMKSLLDKSVLDRAGGLIKPLLQPLVGFGLALVALTWLGTWHTINIERESLRLNNERDAANIALIFEQNMSRTAGALDGILKSLRRHYERDGYKADWPKLLQEEYVVDDATVQIAVIDASGMMITSTSALHPDPPVDLSDREHFKVHRAAVADKLYVSAPVLGRASGVWSVQFTRRFTDRDGKFAGVIVVSLDPAHLTRAYSALKLGEGTGLALIGTDGVVRGGTGVFNQMMGQTIEVNTSSTHPIDVPQRIGADASNSAFLLVSRDVPGFPLKVFVSVLDLEHDMGWLRSRRNYLAAASAFSLLVLMASFGFAVRRHRFETHIVHLATHDSLTNLPNRLFFLEELRRALPRHRPARGFAVHVLDLDGFKLVNDTHGHAIGDLLLKTVAKRLAESLRKADFLARLGGDEFAVIQFVDDFETDAAAMAHRLCQLVSAPFSIDGIHIVIGASIGIASGRPDNGSNLELLKAADLALYAAKAGGRGTYRFYDDGMNLEAQSRMVMETGLRSALEDNEFELHYQPIQSIDGRETVAYEALLRWNHPVLGLISPADFIPIAEETNLIVPIGEWVFNKACEDIVAHRDRPRVAVNCSPVQFKRSNIVETVRKALEASGLEPGRLEVEITESMLIQDDENVTRRLRELQALGVRISMDDFGTGFSCLSYLERYPINTIKIDQSFVAKLASGKKTRAIVRAIIDLANGLNMSTIAEGVETKEQLQALRELGCFEAQGYLFRRPGPADVVLSGSEPTESRSGQIAA